MFTDNSQRHYLDVVLLIENHHPRIILTDFESPDFTVSDIKDAVRKKNSAFDTCHIYYQDWLLKDHMVLKYLNFKRVLASNSLPRTDPTDYPEERYLQQVERYLQQVQSYEKAQSDMGSEVRICLQKAGKNLRAKGIILGGERKIIEGEQEILKGYLMLDENHPNAPASAVEQKRAMLDEILLKIEDLDYIKMFYSSFSDFLYSHFHLINVDSKPQIELILRIINNLHNVKKSDAVRRLIKEASPSQNVRSENSQWGSLVNADNFQQVLERFHEELIVAPPLVKRVSRVTSRDTLFKSQTILEQPQAPSEEHHETELPQYRG